MKVVLFCGGLGMRLREHDENIPKPMVPIGYRPILWHVMKYYAHFGHKDFILCLGYRADVVKNYFRNYDECVSNDFVLSQGGQQNFGRILEDPAPGPHMRESGIPEGGEITCQFGRSAAPCNGVGGRNCRRRKTIETRHPPSEPRCESPLAHFEHGDIRLRNAKTNCRLGLSQPLARPCCPQIRGAHRACDLITLSVILTTANIVIGLAAYHAPTNSIRPAQTRAS